ncbi:MAG: hypothetical protein QW291_03780 [Thermofilaceae archaeon]
MLKLNAKISVIITTIIFVVVTLAAYYLITLPQEGEWKLIVATNDTQKVFTLNELKSVSETVDLTGVGKVNAVPLYKLLLLSGVDLNSTLIYKLRALGADGYSRSIDYAFLYLPGAYVILAKGLEADWGPLRLAVKGLSSKYWVKMLIRVDVENRRWGLALLVNEEPVAIFELDDLYNVAVSLEGIGVAAPLSQLIAECGIETTSVEIIELIGSDGYRSILHPSAIPDIHVLLVPEELVQELGPLRAVVRGQSKSSWVHHLVAINLVLKS